MLTHLDVGEGEVDAAVVGVGLVAVEDDVLQLRPRLPDGKI